MILSTDRTSITPWVTHDERVLQFFGVTDQCVELYVDDDTAGSGQGLAPNQWRIEYFNATGHVYINSTDLGKTEGDSKALSAASAALYPLEEAALYICRTPFYLQVCNAATGPLTGIGGCDAGCEYFPAFTATDDDLAPFTHHGIYDVSCDAGDIMSFDGFRTALTTEAERTAAADLSLDTTPVATPEIWFADGCQSENFLVLDGQEIHLYENFLGVMEVVIPADVCADATIAAAVDAITFHKVADDSILTSYTYDTLCTNTELSTNQVRFFVTAKKGVLSLCDGQCQAFPLADCLVWDNVDTLAGNLQSDGSAIAIGPGNGAGTAVPTAAPACVSLDIADGETDSAGMSCTNYATVEDTCGDFDDADFDANFMCCECGGGTFPGTGEAAAGYALQAGRPFGDDHIVTTTGAAQVDGDSGDDILEDHNAEAFLIGNAGSDTLISRNGKDALWGGNAFAIQACVDTAYTDSEGNGCSWYETNFATALCGTYDVLSPAGSEMYADVGCCICGGGNALAISPFTAMNTASSIQATPTPTIGDQDTYVIYPTTEKTIDLMWIEAAVTAPGN